MICKCGSTDFKEVKENVQQSYKACRACGYSFAMEKPEKNLSASEWVQLLQKNYSEASEALKQAEKRLSEGESNLSVALKNAAQRELARTSLQLEVADSVSKIVEATKEGQLTILIPEVGMYTFEWGDFNLFKIIGNERKA